MHNAQFLALEFSILSQSCTLKCRKACLRRNFETWRQEWIGVDRGWIGGGSMSMNAYVRKGNDGWLARTTLNNQMSG